jgi:hypothetical protein
MPNVCSHTSDMPMRAAFGSACSWTRFPRPCAAKRPVAPTGSEPHAKAMQTTGLALKKQGLDRLRRPRGRRQLLIWE